MQGQSFAFDGDGEPVAFTREVDHHNRPGIEVSVRRSLIFPRPSELRPDEGAPGMITTNDKGGLGPSPGLMKRFY